MSEFPPINFPIYLHIELIIDPLISNRFDKVGEITWVWDILADDWVRRGSYIDMNITVPQEVGQKAVLLLFDFINAKNVDVKNVILCQQVILKINDETIGYHPAGKFPTDQG